MATKEQDKQEGSAQRRDGVSEFRSTVKGTRKLWSSSAHVECLTIPVKESWWRLVNIVLGVVSIASWTFICVRRAIIQQVDNSAQERAFELLAAFFSMTIDVLMLAVYHYSLKKCKNNDSQEVFPEPQRVRNYLDAFDDHLSKRRPSKVPDTCYAFVSLLGIQLLATWTLLIAWEIFVPQARWWDIIPVMYMFFWNITLSHYFAQLRNQLSKRGQYLNHFQALQTLDCTEREQPTGTVQFKNIRRQVKNYSLYSKRLDQTCEDDGMLFAWPIIIAFVRLNYWIAIGTWVYRSNLPTANVFIAPLIVKDALFVIFTLYLCVNASQITSQFQSLGRSIIQLCDDCVFAYPQDGKRNIGAYKYLDSLCKTYGFSILGVVIRPTVSLVVAIPVTAIAVLTLLQSK